MRIAALLLALALSACAAGLDGGASAPGVPGADARIARPARSVEEFGRALVRRVAPFPVTDPDGKPVREPFLGGFNVPRPQFADIDGDGDHDLFVQEVAGRVGFFERTDAGLEFTWRTDRFADLEVGEWYRFVDLDDDGDLDLVAEQLFSHIRAYRNVGDARSARFELAVDTLRDVTGRPIFSDRQNIPNLVDIDCDGRLDLFLGQITGTVVRYEAAGTDAGGIPRFEFVTDRWEDIEIVGMMASRHGANTLSFGDVEGDGDLDLFWGDFFEPGVLLIRNRGTCEAPDFRGEPEPFPVGDPLLTSGYNAPAPADLDGDGDLDMAVGVLGGAFNSNRSIVDNLYLLRQGTTWSVETGRLLATIDVGSDSVPRAVDLDGDGDLDLVVGNKIDPDRNETGSLRVFRNVGTATRPALVEEVPWRPAESFHPSPAFGDLDADGTPDFLLGRWNRHTDRWAGVEGAAGRGVAERFREVAAPYVELTRGSNSSPALADLDADGDLDLVVGEASGTLNLYRNEGTAQAPRFALVSDEWNGWRLGRRAVPAFGDLDGDGDLDLLVGTDLQGVLVFENVGTAQEASYEPRGALPIPAPVLAAPALGDFDADGDLDLVVGGMPGGLLYFENAGVR